MNLSQVHHQNSWCLEIPMKMVKINAMLERREQMNEKIHPMYKKKLNENSKKSPQKQNVSKKLILI